MRQNNFIIAFKRIEHILEIPCIQCNRTGQDDAGKRLFARTPGSADQRIDLKGLEQGRRSQRFGRSV